MIIISKTSVFLRQTKQKYIEINSVVPPIYCLRAMHLRPRAYSPYDAPGAPGSGWRVPAPNPRASVRSYRSTTEYSVAATIRIGGIRNPLYSLASRW